MMSGIKCEVPASLIEKLRKRRGEIDLSVSDLVRAALAEYLDEPLHTMFQVSTSGALVQGKYAGSVTCEKILAHGDFGLGTFEDLDGEMVVLGGGVYRIRGTGEVTKASLDATAPFAVVTTFRSTIDSKLDTVRTFDELKLWCDAQRRSDNLFYAFRVDGVFDEIRTRAVSPSKKPGSLLEASKTQTEFEFSGVEGTLVGIFSPSFSRTFGIPGYHFHFISKDMTKGGHLLQMSGHSLHLQGDELSDFHLVLPQTEEFLRANLSMDTSADLKQAEG